MKKHILGTNGYMLLKLDMSKAYDRVEWSFMENLMRKMGFDEIWIGFIMVTGKMVTYSIIINGKPKRLIQLTRGIRQGDPLSSFLFLMCTKGLHGIRNQAMIKGEITCFSIYKRGLKLTNLSFMDNSLLFCKATSKECGKVMRILSTYEEASRQKIKKNKTVVFFSRSAKEDTRNY